MSKKKFMCCFKEEMSFANFEYDCWTTEAFDSEDAAESFAAYAFGNRDMWELGDKTWTDNYSVAVREVSATEWELFNIEVESQPVFYPKKVG